MKVRTGTEPAGIYFNSIKVRLEFSALMESTSFCISFQFHKGAIGVTSAAIEARSK